MLKSWGNLYSLRQASYLQPAVNTVQLHWPISFRIYLCFSQTTAAPQHDSSARISSVRSAGWRDEGTGCLLYSRFLCWCAQSNKNRVTITNIKQYIWGARKLCDYFVCIFSSEMCAMKTCISIIISAVVCLEWVCWSASVCVCVWKRKRDREQMSVCLLSWQALVDLNTWRTA